MSKFATQKMAQSMAIFRHKLLILWREILFSVCYVFWTAFALIRIYACTPTCFKV